MQLTLPWDGQQFEAMAQEHLLSASALKSLLGMVTLASVYQALREIGWTKPNE